LIEVTDFSSEDWWTGIKQTVKQESSASTGDRHGGRKRLQTQSFAYGVFPANHVKTISISPVPKELAKGTVLVMQNAAQVWRRCRVVEPAGWMSKKIKVHYIGYMPKWDEWMLPNSKRIAGVTASVDSPTASGSESDYSSGSSEED